MDDKSRQNEQILNILPIYTHAGTISAPVANQHSSALNWNVFSHSGLLLHERVFAHLPHFVPIYQFGQITLKRPFWCRPMVLLRASTLKHSARLSTQILSLSQGLRITVLFFFCWCLGLFCCQSLNICRTKSWVCLPDTLPVAQLYQPLLQAWLNVSVQKTVVLNSCTNTSGGCFTATVIM